MKYLFLDIDGVLNTGRHSDYLIERGLCETDEDGYLFDPEAVKHLCEIITASDAGIIITSSWRLDGLQAMRDMWSHRKMPGVVIGVTPQIKRVRFCDGGTALHPFGSRGLEIDEWIKRHGGAPYAILDDEDDYLHHQAAHIVLTDPMTGITAEVAQRVVEILNG